MRKLNCLIIAAVCALLFVSCHVTINTRGAYRVKTSDKMVDRAAHVSDYTALNVWSGVDVVLTDEAKGIVRVECDSLLYDAVSISVKGETLMLSMKSMVPQYDGNRSVRIYVPASGVNKLTVSGGSDISSNVKIAVPELCVDLSGNANMTTEIECGRVVLNVTGSTDISLSGSVDLLEFSASGNSNVACDRLIANQVICTISGSSDASFYASEEIRGRVSGNSSVYYRGGAIMVDMQVSGNADISKSINKNNQP